MSKRLVSSIFLIACIFSSVVFAAQDKEQEKIIDLTPWKGTNESMAKLYNSEAGEGYFKKWRNTHPRGIQKKMKPKF